MDSSYVTPFIESVQNVFGTMLQLPVQFGTPTRKEAGKPSYDVSGIIGMSGDIEGAIILSFPTATAERVVGLFAGEELGSTHEDFADAIGELVNMISGGAKAKFDGARVDISCPTVVIGSEHVVSSRKDAVCIAIPCGCDCGDFCVEVAFRRMPAAPAGVGASDAAATVS